MSVWPAILTLVAGRASTAVDQKDVTDAIDVLVGGKFTTGTGPTTARQIEVWAYGSYDDTEFCGSATGTDANLTPDEKTNLRLLTIIPTVATNDKAYKWGPFSIAQAFGGVDPGAMGHLRRRTIPALSRTRRPEITKWFTSR